MKVMSNEAYHSEADHISKSGLDKLRKSPFHYKNREEFVETPQMVFGRAAHHFMLEPDTFWNGYVMAPDVHKNTKVYKQFVVDNADKEVISRAEYETLGDMEQVLHSHPVASDILNHEGLFERSFFTSIRGVKVKCRPDWFSEEFFSKKLNKNTRIVVDYKTAKSGEERQFTNAIFGDFRYYVQGAFYLDVMREAGVEADLFYFIVQEKNPPYPVSVYLLTQDAIQAGREDYLDDLDLFQDCQESGEWPGYNSDQIIPVYPPKWFFMNRPETSF